MLVKFEFPTNYKRHFLMKRNIIILLPGLADNAIVKFTTVARNVRFLPAPTLEDAYATRQLHRQ